MHKVDDLIPLQADYGFYIRVRKPTNEGVFRFRYGVYEEIPADKKNEFDDPRSKPLYLCVDVYTSKNLLPEEKIHSWTFFKVTHKFCHFLR